MAKRFFTILFLCVVTFIWGVSAQTTSLMIEVEIEASDGLILRGSFYSQESANVGVLLLHMNGGNRNQWSPLIPKLQEAGYSVLAVDMRGSGRTGGTTNWDVVDDDVQLWLDWLKTQEYVQGIALVGGSIGANLALIGCANDADCQTVVALSPGLEYMRVRPSVAVNRGLGDRPILFVASYGDTYSADSLQVLAGQAQGEYATRMYTGSQHGTGYFIGRDANRKMESIIVWLNEHTKTE